jgi:hypothetical protein
MWLGIKGKGSSKEQHINFASFPEANGNVTYLSNTVESCQKRLADYLFMLQDYAEAYNQYKNSLRDYTNDKVSFHLQNK